MVFGFNKQNLFIPLAHICKVKNLNKWVPHEFNETQQQQYLHAWIMLDCQQETNHFLIEL